MGVQFFCFLLAAICFFIKGFGVDTGRIDLMNIGFGLITLGVLFG